MKTIISLFIAITLLLSSSIVFSAEYYFCDTGDDKNPGTKEKPMQSYTKAMSLFNKMPAGSSLNFCRGGSFEANTQFRLYNWNCSDEAVCRIGDYGDAQNERPIIYASNITVFNFQDGGGASQDGGYLLENMILRSRTNTGNGIMLFNDVDDLTINNLHIEGFSAGIFSAKANEPVAGANKLNERIVLKNSAIINNKKMGWLGGCKGCLIENNIFERNGSKPVFDHNIYLTGTDDAPSDDIVVRNNTLYQSSFTDGKCRAVSLVGHGIINNLTIDGNTIKEDVGAVDGNCWGIQIDPGYGHLDESFVGLTITNNKIINMGNTGIACASCENVVIKNNDIIDEGAVLTTGISVPGGGEDLLKSKNVVILNNRIAMNGNWGIGVAMGGEHRFTASRNKISIAKASLNPKCFKLYGNNVDTDVSNNTCMNHTSMSLINLIDSDNFGEVIDSSKDTATEMISEEDLTDSKSNLEEPISSDEISTDVTDTPSSNLISRTRNSVSTVPSITSNDSSTTGSSSPVSRSTSSSTTSNSTQVSRSTSSSRGINSKSSRNSTLTGISDINSYSGEAAVNIELQNISGDMESSIEEPINMRSQTKDKSSISSVTVNDVLDASREDNTEVEPSTCRAYAGARCLMR